MWGDLGVGAGGEGEEEEAVQVGEQGLLDWGDGGEEGDEGEGHEGAGGEGGGEDGGGEEEARTHHPRCSSSTDLRGGAQPYREEL